MGIDKIRRLESGWGRAPELIEVENERFKPTFVTKPEPQTSCEGDTARFCCRVTGYPKPRVMWLLNGHTVINGSKHKLVYDGMWQFNGKDVQTSENIKIKVRDHQVSLTIFETSQDMTGYYTCIAKNDLGTDTTRAGLTVNKALSAEEKARLEELAEAEKNNALQKKKDAEEKKKKMEELAQQQKEQQRLQQEQRKSARAAKAQKEKEPAKEPEKVALKKRPEKAQE